MIVRTFRIDGNQRNSSIKSKRSWFVSRHATMQLAPQDIQLVSKHGVLSFKPQLRPKCEGKTTRKKQSSPIVSQA